MTHIEAKNHRGTHQIYIDTIYYVYAIDDDVYIVNNQEYKVNGKLYDYEELPKFIRINKSQVLNITKVQEAKRLFNSKIKLVLTNEEVLYVNRTYIKSFVQYLNGGVTK